MFSYVFFAWKIFYNENKANYGRTEYYVADYCTHVCIHTSVCYDFFEKIVFQALSKIQANTTEVSSARQKSLNMKWFVQDISLTQNS